MRWPLICLAIFYPVDWEYSGSPCSLQSYLPGAEINHDQEGGFSRARLAEESQTFIADLETIDDDLSARGVNMVKISDMETAEDYGVEDLPTVVYFENGIPFVYMGNFL